MIGEIFTLLIVYQLKHFLADYPLQGRYMLGKFKPGWGFLGPLATHAGLHAGLTYLIAVIYLQTKLGKLSLDIVGLILWLTLTDFVIHFTMDRIKAGPKYLGRFKDMMKPYFWWSLGLDQMVHHLTHYYLIWRLVHA